MNSKFYVSFETAKLLKEKEYNEEYINHYDENGEIIIPYYEHEYDKLYPAPTKAEAIDWLESKGIIVELNYDDEAHLDSARWQYFIYTHDKDGWVEAMVCSWHDNLYYKARLEAEEAAIIKALELL